MDDDDDDEISNLVDLHMGMLGGGWKWQDLQDGFGWIIKRVCLQQDKCQKHYDHMQNERINECVPTYLSVLKTREKVCVKGWRKCERSDENRSEKHLYLQKKLKGTGYCSKWHWL